MTRFIYISDTVERLTGWRPDELIGETFEKIVAPATMHVASERWERVAADPTVPQVLRLELMRKDGGTVPVEIHSVAQLDGNGDFAGVHGSARDIARARAPRARAARLRGPLPLPRPVVARPRVDDRRRRPAHVRVRPVGLDPGLGAGGAHRPLVQRARPARGAARRAGPVPRPCGPTRTRCIARGSRSSSRDGRELAMEITSIGMVQDDAFIGAHGAARDVSERDRLEQDIRRQAVELASSEERSHLARELHDSVTQALFSMTLLSRSIELLLVKDPSQVPGKLASLRELQREALAEMRALIFELRPGNVEENGLIQALRTHSAALSGRIGLPVVVEGELADRPSLDVEEGAVPDRPGGAPQRRQARGARSRCGSRSAAWPMASTCASSTTAAGSTRPRSPTATWAWRGCRPARSGWAARSTVASVRDRRHDDRRRRARRAPRPEARRRRSSRRSRRMSHRPGSSARLPSPARVPAPFRGRPARSVSCQTTSSPPPPQPRHRLPQASGLLVVDADDRTRESLVGILGIRHRFTVVGSTGQVSDAIAIVRDKRPDVVIVDPRLPDVSGGVALIRRLRVIHPGRAHPRRRLVARPRERGPHRRRQRVHAQDRSSRATSTPRSPAASTERRPRHRRTSPSPPTRSPDRA